MLLQATPVVQVRSAKLLLKDCLHRRQLLQAQHVFPPIVQEMPFQLVQLQQQTVIPGRVQQDLTLPETALHQQAIF